VEHKWSRKASDKQLDVFPSSEEGVGDTLLDPLETSNLSHTSGAKVFSSLEYRTMNKFQIPRNPEFSFLLCRPVTAAHITKQLFSYEKCNVVDATSGI
jgi:hypothetical protein